MSSLLRRVTIHPAGQHLVSQQLPSPKLPYWTCTGLRSAHDFASVRQFAIVRAYHLRHESASLSLACTGVIRKASGSPSSSGFGFRRRNLTTGTTANSERKAFPDSIQAAHLRSSLLVTATVAAALAVGLAIAFAVVAKEAAEVSETRTGALQLEIMSAPTQPGRPGNLTAEQEEKLRQFWHAIAKVCGIDDGAAEGRDSVEHKGTAGAEEHEASKKKRFGLFGRKKRSDSKAGATGSSESTPSGSDATEEDKYGQTKQFHETLAKQSPESIRNTIWGMLKCDHPDALVLRFLRARKWDVDKALVMMVSTMNWRHTEVHVDEDIMAHGEAGSLHDEKEGEGDAKKIGRDFMAQIRLGKSFLHGTDKAGRPICVVRVRLHRQGEQCEESLEKFTVYIIETARFALTPPVDTATIVFDMTGFTLANMDYTPLKFMIKVFEANYPECLGAVLVHNAPWVFQGIWKIIRGWLDPVVAGKVHFTNNRKDVEEFIEPGRIIKELGGDEDWEYKYVEPVEGENDKMKDTETRDKLLAEREKLVKEFEKATMQWVRTPEGQDTKEIKAERTKIAAQLQEQYWKLDPYVRARSLYDRQGSFLGGNQVDWYTKEKEKQAAASSNGAAAEAKPVPAAETSADDVD